MLMGDLGSAAHPVGSAVMMLGGFGFLSRLYGLSTDNLVEVEMVLADGRIVHVSEHEHPGACGPLCLYAFSS
jgi:FAD/FMN-containing dehydrogenase